MDWRGDGTQSGGKADGARKEGMKPERYVEGLLQEEARTINVIRSAARWHHEARRFLLDLGRLPELRFAAPRRRA
jgi:hypothetical protein